jgi:hypothetical protein
MVRIDILGAGIASPAKKPQAYLPGLFYAQHRHAGIRCRHGIVTIDFAIVTVHFGKSWKSVTIRRNQRSRSSEIGGHDTPKWPVTLVRNTQHSTQQRTNYLILS